MCVACFQEETELRLDMVETAVKSLAWAVLLLCVGILYDKGVFKGVFRA